MTTSSPGGATEYPKVRRCSETVTVAKSSHDDAGRPAANAVETAEGNELGYGFDTGYRGLVFTISLNRSGVNLGVYGGASLDDPVPSWRALARCTV
jgi:hypothetical protein